MRRLSALFAFALLVLAPLCVHADTSDRDATRDKVWSTLQNYSAISFHQVDGHPYNFSGMLTSGLVNAQSLEVVVSVGAENTLTLYVYPHVRGGYINLNKAHKAAQMMKTLLQMNYTNFLNWGADDDTDVFVGFNFTLESGYPEQSLLTVLDSIKNQDQYVAKLVPLM